MRRKIIAFALLLMLVICGTAISTGALGDDTDYFDGGGGGDSWDWGGDSYDYDDNDYYSDGGGDSDSGSSIWIILIVVAVIMVSAYFNYKKRGSTLKTGSSSATPRRLADSDSMQKLLQADPNFNSADIEGKVKNWVMMFEDSWCNGDMMPCRPFLSDSLFNSYKSQLEKMKENGEKTRSEDLAVLNCSIDSWKLEGSKEYLNVYLKVKKRTYKVDINNPERVTKGYPETTYHIEYNWQLLRTAGSQSGEAGVRVNECPNCGAQVSINQSGKCSYCGSTLVAESFDWVLNKVDKLGQSQY